MFNEHGKSAKSIVNATTSGKSIVSAKLLGKSVNLTVGVS